MNGWLRDCDHIFGEDSRPYWQPGWRVRLAMRWQDFRARWWAG
jgi:hypothetical protein